MGSQISFINLSVPIISTGIEPIRNANNRAGYVFKFARWVRRQSESPIDHIHCSIRGADIDPISGTANSLLELGSVSTILLIPGNQYHKTHGDGVEILSLAH